MSLSNFELLLIGVAITAILMLGTTNIRTNLALYAWHTLFIATCTAWLADMRHDTSLWAIAAVVATVKAWFVPWFLNSILRKVGMESDRGHFLPTALAMHIGIAMLAGSYLLTHKLPSIFHEQGGHIGATVALSLIATGMLLMLTRNIAVNQVIGFLVIENGIYLFSLTQTHGMPMGIEMGVLLDLLVAVMIAGLLLFRIKKNFEHIDVSKLTELRD
jgi:hydrogenase-4 component E